MEPLSSTPEQLILRARPVRLGLGLSAAMLIFAAIWLSKAFGDQKDLGVLGLLFGLFALMFAVFVRQEVAIFDRASQTLTLRSASVFGVRSRSHTLEGVQRAVSEIDTDSEGRKRMARPVLKYATGKAVPLSSIFRAGSSSEASVKAVNAWLKPHKGRPS